MRPGTRRLHAGADAPDTLQRIAVQPSHGGRHNRAPGAVQEQVRRPPGLAPVVRLVEIPDRCEKIPLGLLEVRLRYSKGRSQAQ